MASSDSRFSSVRHFLDFLWQIDLFWTDKIPQHPADLLGEPAGHPHLCGVASGWLMGLPHQPEWNSGFCQLYHMFHFELLQDSPFCGTLATYQQPAPPLSQQQKIGNHGILFAKTSIIWQHVGYFSQDSSLLYLNHILLQCLVQLQDTRCLLILNKNDILCAETFSERRNIIYPF